jgi:hypothetical protein
VTGELLDEESTLYIYDKCLCFSCSCEYQTLFVSSQHMHVNAGCALPVVLLLNRVFLLQIQRFTSLSDLYIQIGFHRKASFCRRLAATRHVSAQNPQPNWAQCYQLMLQALSGHKLSLDPTEFPKGMKLNWNKSHK